jgi:hypothetical protein
MGSEKRTAPSELDHFELNGFTLPANVRLQMGESGLMVGNHYSNGMGVSGVVEKLTYIGSGVVRVAIGERVLLVFATGMVAEVTQ